MVVVAQRDTARSLGVVLIFGVNRRYSLLGVAERRVFLDVAQTVTPFDCSSGVRNCLPFILIPDVHSALLLVSWWIWCTWLLERLLLVEGP
jgi:hypothetical protein